MPPKQASLSSILRTGAICLLGTSFLFVWEGGTKTSLDEARFLSRPRQQDVRTVPLESGPRSGFVLSSLKRKRERRQNMDSWVNGETSALLMRRAGNDVGIRVRIAANPIFFFLFLLPNNAEIAQPGRAHG